MSPNPKRNRKKANQSKWNKPGVREFELPAEFDTTPTRIPSRDQIQKGFEAQKASTSRRGDGKSSPSYTKHLHKWDFHKHHKGEHCSPFKKLKKIYLYFAVVNIFYLKTLSYNKIYFHFVFTFLKLIDIII